MSALALHLGLMYYTVLAGLRNSGLESAVPENPTLEPNVKWIG